MQERFLRELMKMVKCVVCGRRYASANVSVLGHQDELWFLSVSCPHCHSQGLVAALIRERKTEPPNTDLTEEEQARFQESAPVGAEDVLDIHTFLRDFDGDFAKLFRPSR